MKIKLKFPEVQRVEKEVEVTRQAMVPWWVTRGECQECLWEMKEGDECMAVEVERKPCCR
jgi:hypothetical protein